MKTYNKLVRGKIPEICLANGDVPTTRVLTDDTEYANTLYDKLDEESQEVREAAETGQKENVLGELADELEIIRAIAKVHGYTFDDVEAARVQKFNQRGGFDERIFLISTERA